MKNLGYAILLLLSPLLVFGQWTQLGTAIPGANLNDNFGYASSFNSAGEVMIAGSYRNNNQGDFSGHAQVHEWDGLDWVQRGENIEGNVGEWSAFEVAIDGSGNRVAVGAIQGLNSSSGLMAGIVRVYDWDGTRWTQTGSTLEGIGSPLGSDWFGSALSFSEDGNILAVGARLNDNSGGNAGQARIFQWDGTDWVQMGSDILGDDGFDELGGDLSLNAAGNIIALGAIGNGNSGFGPNVAGYASVFEWNGTEWIQRGNPLTGEISGDDYGRSVSLSASGDILAVGAPGYDVISGNLENTAYIYEWDGNDWAQRGSTLTGEIDIDLFGWSVSLNASGNMLAVGGAPFSSIGSVRIFEWDGTAWDQQGDKLTGLTTSDFFGSSVTLNAIGNRLAVSAWGGQDLGEVRVFENASIVSTQDLVATNINCFPNPAIDQLKLSTSEKIEWIKLYGSTGRQVMTQKGASNKMNLKLNQIKAGAYFLEVKTQNQISTLMVFKI